MTAKSLASRGQTSGLSACGVAKAKFASASTEHKSLHGEIINWLSKEGKYSLPYASHSRPFCMLSSFLNIPENASLAIHPLPQSNSQARHAHRRRVTILSFAPCCHSDLQSPKSMEASCGRSA